MKKKIISSVFLILVIVVSYYLLSPIFTKVTVNDVFPVTSEGIDNGVSMASPVPYQVFGTAGHPATGTVSIISAEEGEFIRYENFQTINGPDLFVYLSKDLKARDFINLGELSGTEGEMNYLVPSEIDVNDYKYVLVWCKQFGVLFNYAELQVVKDDNADMVSSESSMSEGKMVGVEDEAVIIKKVETKNMTETNSIPQIKTAILATGCFWCVEHDLVKVKGVINVLSGYAGGKTENPTYKNYSEAGHREVVEVTYDSTIVSFANLVEHIIKHGDPTDGGGSFKDRGQAYAPAIYYGDEDEKVEAEKIISAVDKAKIFTKPLTIKVLPEQKFWPAEDYHQDYADKNPIRYGFYRSASGRDAFIEKYWGESASDFTFSKKVELKTASSVTASKENSWQSYVKPAGDVLKKLLTPLQYKVTQEEGTERAFDNEYDKNYQAGIYVDIVSGEPLYSSADKYDSGTGWPSFVKPITKDAVVLKEDRKLFSVRTEVKSHYADSHLGHVFNDGPTDKGGLRYCMNSAALRFVAKADMEKEGYGYLLSGL